MFSSSGLYNDETCSLAKMTDFFDKGYAIADLVNPTFAQLLLNDVNEEEIIKLLYEEQDKPWELLTTPRTQAFRNFVGEVYAVRSISLPK